MKQTQISSTNLLVIYWHSMCFMLQSKGLTFFKEIFFETHRKYWGFWVCVLLRFASNICLCDADFSDDVSGTIIAAAYNLRE